MPACATTNLSRSVPEPCRAPGPAQHSTCAALHARLTCMAWGSRYGAAPRSTQPYPISILPSPMSGCRALLCTAAASWLGLQLPSGAPCSGPTEPAPEQKGHCNCAGPPLASWVLAGEEHGRCSDAGDPPVERPLGSQAHDSSAAPAACAAADACWHVPRQLVRKAPAAHSSALEAAAILGLQRVPALQVQGHQSAGKNITR